VLEVRPEQRLTASLLEQVNVVNRREGGLVEAYVPISMIYTQDVPVDITHVKELAESIEEEQRLRPESRTGQLSPILLGQIEDFGQFAIVDGFHRVPALKRVGSKEVFATIRPKCTWEEIVDLRILAATTHRAVRFSRLIEWIEEAWQYSPWAEKIKASQAFQLKFVKGMTGAKSGLTSEEAEDIKGWVDKKCESWHVSAGLVYQNLSIARTADPDLVKEARERRSGNKLEAITPMHLSVISKVLPYRYEIQKLVAQAAKEHNLTVPKTRALAAHVSNIDDAEEVIRIINSGKWLSLEPVYSPSRQRELRKVRKEDQNYQALIDKFFEDEMEIARLSIENAILAGRYVPQDTTKEPTSTNIEGPDNGAPDIDPFKELESSSVSQLTSKEQELVFQSIDNMRQDLIRYLSAKFGVKSQNCEDIVQDAVLKIVNYSNTGQLKREYLDPGRLKTLMLRAVQFTRVDWFRKELGRKGQTPHPYLNPIDEIEVGTSDYHKLGYEEQGFEEIEDQKEEYLQKVKFALPDLTEEQRRVVVLRVFFDLNPFRVGQILGKDPQTVDSVFYQSRQKLRKILTVEKQI